MKITASFTIIAIAGQTGSGKTSLGKQLCQLLGATFSSFGSFVREEAGRRGIKVDRLSLQNLGQSLIDELGPEEFVRSVLSFGKTEDLTTMVVDGVRSVEIWQSIQKLTSNSALIYLDIDESIRLERIIRRDKLDFSAIRSAMEHPMELNVPKLREYADIVLYDSPIDTMASRAVELLVLRGLVADK